MANNHTNVRATDGQGQHLSIHSTTTDSPILPAGNIQQLKEIDPKLVDWVIQQTEIEASHRRASENRINWFIFIERLSGVLVGGLVAIFGFGVGGYLILKGHGWYGVTLAGSTLGTIVTVLVTKHKASQADDAPPPKKRTKTTRPIAPRK